MDSISPGVDTCQIPISKPPSGVPNFVDPPSLGIALIIVIAIMITWTTIFLAGRLWVNRHRLQISDIVAYIISVAGSGFVLSMTKTMRHQYDIPLCWLNTTRLKAAILLLLLQLFSVSKGMRISIYIGFLGIVLTYGPNLILGPFYMVPRPGQSWEDLTTRDWPYHLKVSWLVQACVTVVLDLYIFILPFPILGSLNLGTRRRLKLVALFGTALLGVIASIVGLAIRIPLLTSDDTTWEESKVFICTMVEIYIAIIVSCVPAFTRFVRVYIFDSSFYNSFASHLRGRKPKSGSTEMSPYHSFQRSDKMLTTFSGNKPPRAYIQRSRNLYCNLDEQMWMQTEWSSSSHTINERSGSVVIADMPRDEDLRRYHQRQPGLCPGGFPKTDQFNQSCWPRQME